MHLERMEGREKERDRNINGWEIHGWGASCTPPTEDLACNPGMCPDWESNWWPFSLQTTLNPLSHTSQGFHGFLMKRWLSWWNYNWSGGWRRELRKRAALVQEDSDYGKWSWQLSHLKAFSGSPLAFICSANIWWASAKSQILLITLWI